MPADQTDLHHHWRSSMYGKLGPAWECPECLRGSESPYDGICPNRVAAAFDKLTAEVERLRLDALDMVRIRAEHALLVRFAGQPRTCGQCGAPVGGADWWPCALPAGHDGHHASAARLILDAHQAKR